MSNNLNMLLEKVIEPDYCIGCGVCASIDNSPLTMKFTEDGTYKPILREEAELDALTTDLMRICPFSDYSDNETDLGRKLFDSKEIDYNEYSGYYLKNFAGHVKADDYRKRGASGGMGTWVASKLLELELVDAVIHVKSGDINNDEKMYQYDISYNVKELKMGAKSKYYPIELSQIIKEIKKSDKTYAVIGIPCFIKSLRLLANNDPIIKKRIKFHIGLVCGHLKSSFFAEAMAWEMGIQPNDLEYLDFRKKFKDSASNAYGVEAVGDGKTLSAQRKELYSTNWGQGFFKYNACEFCDDVLSETADITIGDAWLPEYAHQKGGVNIVVVRNPVFLKIINQFENELALDELSSERIYQSQAGGFRHRRDGLAYRLYLKDKKKLHRPIKRVEASNDLSNKRKKIYESRMSLSEYSFDAFKLAKKKEDFNVFKLEMDTIVSRYNKLVKVSFPKRVYRKLKRIIKE